MNLLSNVEVICADTEREKWLAARREGIGSSDAPAILGVSPYAGPLAIYTDKLFPTQESEREESEILRWGHLLEPIILSELGREIGKPVDRCGLLIRSREWPWMQATLDGLVKDNGDEIPAEAKNTAWKGADWTDGVPDYVRAQVQHQLAVTGAPRSYVAALFFGNQLRWVEVERDEAFIREVLVPTEEAFYNRLAALDAPDPDASESAKQALKRLYPKDSGEVITLPGEFIDLDLQLVQLKEAVKGTRAEIDAIENRIKATLGDASEGELPNGVKYTFRTQARKECVVKATEFRVLCRSERK